jgi:hypothetical protein
MGIAVGLKLTEIPFAVALLAIELVNFSKWGELVKREFVNCIGLAAGFIVSYGYWAYYLYVNYKNPLFPYANSLFGSPYFPKHPVEGAQYYPHTIVSAILMPFYFLRRQSPFSDASFIDPRFAALLVMVVLFVAYLIASHYTKRIPKPKISRETVALLLFIATSYILWEKIYSYYRYAEVIEFLSLAAITIIVWSVIRFVKLSMVVSLIIIVPIAVVTIPMYFGRTPWQSSYFGVQLPVNYLTTNATILQVGGGPTAFLIPFFPANDTFIRIGGNIGVPPNPPQTAAYKQLVRSAIRSHYEHGSTFYALGTVDSSITDQADTMTAGFKDVSCVVINTTYEPKDNYFTLCKLTKV